MKAKTKVYVRARSAGVNPGWGSVGQVISAKTGRILAEAQITRPYGFNAASLRDAEDVARSRGYEVVDLFDA